MRSACLQLAPLALLCLLASGQLCAQDAEHGFPHMPPPASMLTPPVIENKGQFNEVVRFIVLGPNGTVIFTRDSVVIVLRNAALTAPSKDDPTSAFPSDVREAALTRRAPIGPSQAAEVIRIAFTDPDPSARIAGTNELPARANRLVGRDSSKWVNGIPVFEGIEYRDVRPGTNLVFGMNFGRFTCTAGGTGVELEQAGGGSIDLPGVGELLSRAVGVTDQETGKPLLQGGWAVERSLRTMVDRQGIFVSGTVYLPRGTALDKPSDFDADCFVIRADYTSGKPSWVTFFGGGADDVANAVCVDRHGYVYLTGYTQSDDLPVTGDAYKKEYNGYQDYFTARLTPSGTSLAHAGYLGVGAGGLGLEPFAARWAPAFEGKQQKLLAIMVDDGREVAQIKPFLDLGIPLTFALMPWAEPRCIEQVTSHGCVPFLHAPMEALGSVNRRTETIDNTQTERQVDELLEGWLALTPGVMGISNHTGSAATSDPETMRRVAAAVRRHGLMFYDSNTAPVSIGANVFRDRSVPCLEQDFFLDERDVPLVRARLLAMADLAERTGYATCICHVGRPQVPEGIKSVIAELQGRGFRFVTVPELYKTLTRTGE